MYDVLIIGAGCVGSAIARELSKYSLSIAILEKENDVACGTSKANSGIVHGGYDAAYDSLKGKLSKEGNRSFTLLSEQLDFSLNRCGSFVLALSEQDEKKNTMLLENGKKNGIDDLHIVGKEFILQKEPYVNENVKSALYCPSAGIISPYEYTIALIENAVSNGVKLYRNAAVKSIVKNDKVFTVKTDTSEYKSKVIINAAGVNADDIYSMVAKPYFSISAVRGEYMLFDKNESYKANSVLFQVPSGGSKGVLVSPTVHGNIYVGPSYDKTDDKDDVSTHSEVLNSIFSKATESIPSMDKGKVITQFAGIRAVSTNGDFIIEQSEIEGFINVAGICSPGLSTSYVIAKKTAETLDSILPLKQNKAFNPYRKKIPQTNTMSPKELNELIKKDPSFGRIVCRCERITEGEIIACIQSCVGAYDVDGVKRRVRAGMGRCQGGFCMQRVMEILSKQLGCDMSEITKNSHGSYIVTGDLFGDR